MANMGKTRTPHWLTDMACHMSESNKFVTLRK
jgi:hypothetical protein